MHTTVGQFARNVTEELKNSAKHLDQFANALAVLPMRRVKQMEDPRLREQRMLLDQLAHRGLRALLERVHGMQDAIQLLDPERILARGFSVARHQGRPVLDPTLLKVGDTLETTFAYGRTRSTINTIDNGRGTNDL